jgi:hypothetical protein
MADKKLYIVETISMFRMRYVVEALEEGHALDEVVCGIGNTDFQEFSQHHVDEVITSSREISFDEYLKIFDKDNDYLQSWTEEKKMEFINKIDYDKE